MSQEVDGNQTSMSLLQVKHPSNGRRLLIAYFYLNQIMESSLKGKVAVIGCGPVGSTLAIMLCMKGFEVDIYEKREDPTSLQYQQKAFTRGRSMNLGLSYRGMSALNQIGMREEVLQNSI